MAGDLTAPTADEQYMLELVNRLRANPAAEGQRLYALAQTDPVLKAATRNWDMNQFVQVINSFAAVPPLAFNTRLIAAARVQNSAMLAANNQFHSPSGFLTNTQVAQAPDGQAYYPVAQGSWATGENVFAYSQNVQRPRLRDYVDYLYAGFVIDWGNPDYGHLHNLLAPGPSGAAPGSAAFSEIGVGLHADAVPVVPSPVGINVGPVLTTQEFGWRTGASFLTGTFYRDTDGDQFYSPGEGIGNVVVTARSRTGAVYQAVTWPTGGYSLNLPAGTYSVTATGAAPDPLTTTVTIGLDNVGWGGRIDPNARPAADLPVPGDYDGDGRADRAVFQAATALWYLQSSGNGQIRVFNWGVAGAADTPVPADYDGDGKTDLAVYQPSTGLWQIRTMGAATTSIQAVWGLAGGGDIPAPGDYDGDGRADLAVYRPSTGQWFIRGSAGGVIATSFGQPGVDVPVPADFDGDGKLELAVYRPSTAQWFIGTTAGATLINGHVWGLAGGPDVPTPADYDGDGRADLAVYRPGTGQWIVNLGGLPPIVWGAAGSADQPAPADYDGDRKVDLTVYRPEDANWYTMGSRSGISAVLFGRAGVGTSMPALVGRGVTAFGMFTARTALGAAGVTESSGRLAAIRAAGIGPRWAAASARLAARQRARAEIRADLARTQPAPAWPASARPRRPWAGPKIGIGSPATV